MARSKAPSPQVATTAAAAEIVTKSASKVSTASPAKASAKPQAASAKVATESVKSPASKPATPVKPASAKPVAAKAAVPTAASASPAPAGKSKAAAPKANAVRVPRKDAPVAKVAAKAPLARKGRKASEPIAKGRPALIEGSIPETYGMDRLVAMPKDPEWTHLYWELKPETVEAIRQDNGGKLPSFHLRGYDTTDILFDGTNAPVSLDLEVAPYARSWYLQLPYQGRVYTFEYGHVNQAGQWVGVLRSQPVGFHAGMADLGNEEWISIASEELFRVAAGLGEGEGISDLLRRLRDANSAGMGGAAWLTSFGSGMGRMEIAPSSFGLSSWQHAAAGLGLSSSFGTSPMGSGVTWGGSSPTGIPGRPEKSKDFWLWVETEIILYGATEPDAKVTLNGKHLQLNADGTFRLQFPFPDGTHHDFHVKAIDRDGDQSREARPAARRWTEG
jgi:hypothetical protein